jgi:predicted DNA-binding transcriptional regulator
MFNPFELQNKTLERTDISLGAKVIMIRLRNSAGKIGKIRYRVKKLADAIGVSERQARYYIKELITVGLLKRKFIPGHSNWWFITDVYGIYETPATHCSTVKETIKKRTNVCSNVIFSQSKPKDNLSPNIHHNFQQKPFNLPLVNRILKETGDKKSTNYWIMIVRKLPESEISEYLSHLTIAMNEGIVRSPGAYLNSIILANHPEFRISSPNNPPIRQQNRYVEPDEPEIIPASEEVARKAIAEIMAKLNRKAG